MSPDKNSDTDLSHHAAALLEMQLNAGAECVIRIKGHSMGATLSPQAEIQVRPLLGTVQTGEIILLKLGDSYIAHRIIGHTADGLIRTKGDGWFIPDTPVPVSSILGQVIGIMQDGVLHTPWHWRKPWRRFIGFLSLFEGIMWPHFNYPLRVIHRTWRFAWKHKLPQEDPHDKPSQTS